jgi:hypothetical protein
MFKKRTLRKIFEPDMKEMTGGWRELNNEGIHNLHTLQNIIGIIKSKGEICWAYSTHMRKEKCMLIL